MRRVLSGQKAVDQSSAWVFKSLWKEDSMFSSKLPILDTLLYERQNPNSFTWLFTDKSGFVAKKSAIHTNFDDILFMFFGQDLSTYKAEKLHSERNDSAISVLFIDDREVKYLNKAMAIPKVLGVHFSESTVLIKAPDEHQPKIQKFYTEIAKKEGTHAIKVFKQFENGKTLIRSAKYIETLTRLSIATIKSVEKNREIIVICAHLVFAEDKAKKL